jgi:hypothetical protein
MGNRIAVLLERRRSHWHDRLPVESNSINKDSVALEIRKRELRTLCESLDVSPRQRRLPGPPRRVHTLVMEWCWVDVDSPRTLGWRVRQVRQAG